MFEQMTTLKKHKRKIAAASAALLIITLGFAIGNTVFQIGFHYGIQIHSHFGIGTGAGSDIEVILTTYHIDEDGNRVQLFSVQQVVTLAFKAYARQVLGDNSFTSVGFEAWRNIAIGTGAATLTESDTALTAEFARAIGTYAELETYNWTCTYTWSAGSFSGQNITQYGLFNAAAAGTALDLYGADSGVVLTASDSLEVTYKVMHNPP